MAKPRGKSPGSGALAAERAARQQLSAAQRAVLWEAWHSARLKHGGYIPTRRRWRSARVLVRHGLCRITQRWGWRAVAITDAGRDELGVARKGHRPKLRVIQGGAR